MFNQRLHFLSVECRTVSVVTGGVGTAPALQLVGVFMWELHEDRSNVSQNTPDTHMHPPTLTQSGDAHTHTTTHTRTAYIHPISTI